ncbi:MAG: cytochrome b subunit of the bc complex, partial [Rhodospirillales bacterium]|nr:cytochrome b subunit of the bc complex [Rhodospirillales bacterium]
MCGSLEDNLIRRVLQNRLSDVEALFDRAFGPSWNPFLQLGTLAFFFFWIAAVSGIYLFIFFETSAVGAYQSIEHMTHAQWYYSGIIRSLHRYSSDAMVVTAVLHLGREFILDRYRGVRWFSWFTGVPVLWFLYMSGIGGYWLVWDKLAQYVAVASMEWLDWLGIFGEPVAANFLTRGSLDDRFFTLLVFLHIFVPLVLLFLMWVHILRIGRPKVNPKRGLAIGSLSALV